MFATFQIFFKMFYENFKILRFCIFSVHILEPWLFYKNKNRILKPFQMIESILFIDYYDTGLYNAHLWFNMRFEKFNLKCKTCIRIIDKI